MSESPDTPQSPTTPGSPEDEDSSPGGPDERLAGGADGSGGRSSASAERSGEGSASGGGGGSAEAPEEGLIPDERLPEDLQPEKNPLAADPDDSDDTGASPGPDGPGDGPVPG